jgi:hypothetical protein
LHLHFDSLNFLGLSDKRLFNVFCFLHEVSVISLELFQDQLFGARNLETGLLLFIDVIQDLDECDLLKLFLANLPLFLYFDLDFLDLSVFLFYHIL